MEMDERWVLGKRVSVEVGEDEERYSGPGCSVM